MSTEPGDNYKKLDIEVEREGNFSERAHEKDDMSSDEETPIIAQSRFSRRLNFVLFITASVFTILATIVNVFSISFGFAYSFQLVLKTAVSDVASKKKKKLKKKT